MAKIKKFFESLGESIQVLRKSPRIKVQACIKKIQPVPDRVLERRLELLEQRGLPEVSPDIKESLGIYDNLSIAWGSKKPMNSVGHVYGEFFLKSVLWFGTGPDGAEGALRCYQASHFSPSLRTKLKNARVIDYPRESGNNDFFAMLPVSKGKFVDKVFVFNGYDTYETTLTYKSYLEQLAKTRGIHRWQYLFCDSRKLKKVGYNFQDQLGKGLELMEMEFPKDNFSDLWRRFEKLPPVR